MARKPTAADVVGVQRLLHILGYKHLRTRLERSAIVVESGPAEEPEPHLRLSKVGEDLWRAELPSSTERWRRIPILAPRGNLIAEVHQSFPWLLQERRGTG